MKKFKQIVCMLVVCLMILSAAACSGNGNSSAASSGNNSAAGPEQFKGSTVSYFVSLQAPSVYSSNSEMLCYQMAEDATGIKVEWVHPPKGQETEQFNLIVVSDDKPDIIEHNWRTFSGGPDYAIETKVIMDLTDAAKTYMPEFSKYIGMYPDLVMQISSDKGRLYEIPYIFTNSPDGSAEWQSIMNRVPYNETYVGLIMRGDWLEELGLEVPNTLDEYINVLTQFRDKKNAIPFSTTSSFLKQSNFVASAFDVVSDKAMFQNENGKAVFAPILDGYKEYLKVMHQMYDEKLLDADYAVQDNTTNQAKITSDQCGMWLGYYSSWCNNLYDQLKGNDPSNPFYPVGGANPVLTADQQLKWVQADYAFRNTGAAIAANSKNVGAALTFMNWAFTDEGDLAMNWGKEGESFTWSETHWPLLGDKVINDPDQLGNATAIQKFTRKNGPVGMDYYNRLILGQFSGTEEGLKALAIWNSERNGNTSASMPPTTATSEESARLSALSNEISTYVSECTAKFIMGEMSIDEFDNFKTTLNSMGLEEYIKLTQDALDRYYARVSK